MPFRFSRRIALTLLMVSASSWADTNPGVSIANQGIPEKGVAPCMSCHGPDGAGMAPTAYPRIAGMNAGYIIRQLKNFRIGMRSNPVMMPMAKNLSDKDIEAVSAYYAEMPIPSPAAQPPSDDAKKIANDLIQWGDWNGRTLPACTQCHATDGNGIGSFFPGITAQHSGYIKAQLLAWKAGTRSNDPLGLMKSVADQLTEKEIDAVAAYYAAQAGAKPIPAQNTAAVFFDTPKGEVDDVHSGDVHQQGAPPVGRKPGKSGYFQSPPRDAIADTPLGDAVRQGQAIFQDTNTHPVSSRHVGNNQACGNCHIDAGRLARSAPLWAAWVDYPAYRSKTGTVNTFIERIQGCFTYSMNAQASSAGGPPTADSDTMVSLTAYSFWLAKGAPTGDAHLPGRGYQRLEETQQGFDPQRGAAVYAAKCALCHGENGAGVTNADGRTLFPPLWGAESYNWGAGMHKIDTAAAFVKHNMPLGLRESLSDQDAWDVAAYMNSHERPQDPRFAGDLQQTAKKFHASKFSLYGKHKSAEGFMLGEHPATAPKSQQKQ